MTRKILCLMVMLLPLCFVLCGCMDKSSDAGAEAETDAEAGYEDTLFDTSFVHQIDVQISEEDWNDLKANAIEKTKYKVNVDIDGERMEDVAFSTKGNSSLIFVAAETDQSRYSFKLNFGKFVDGQTYRGLNKVNLNNSFCDATYMKDYICYRLFRQAGVPAPLTSYVWLTINGEDRGLYLAVEDESESFLAREYEGKGVIYKPESKDLGLSLDKVKEIRENGLPMTADPHGSDLIYKDDALESYPDIFENAETDATEQDDQAVLAAIRSLSEGTDLESQLDTSEIIRFFVAHNFVLNYDSYTGAMLHNLVLVESEGRMSVIPWDYNLAFGTFVPGVGQDVLKDATDLLNQEIDSPLIGTVEDDRPLWKWIESDNSYLAEYHDALDALVADYFESGQFDSEFDETYELLLPYVKKDPTAFYSADEYTRGCKVLKQFCERRAESIRSQLDGKQDKVDASDLSIIEMGAFIDREQE